MGFILRVMQGISMYRNSWGPRQATRPLLLVRPLTRPMVSHWLTEVPVEFHYRAVTFGVVGQSLPLVFVKLMDTWVLLTFLCDALGY